MSVEEHRKEGAERGPLRVASVTVSDTRTPETDENGAYLRAALEEAGHDEVFYAIVPDEPERVLEALNRAKESDAQAILFNGGTGIASRDTTFDALSGVLEKTLPGFGEIFRTLSYGQVGAAAMLSRATAGVWRGTLVVSMPGSPKAVRLAWEKLLAPELAHLIREISR